MRAESQRRRPDTPPDPHFVARVEAWFARTDRTVSAFQRDTWAAQRAGRSGLVHSPTGSGKTLAAWLGLVARWPGGVPRTGLQVLWITPLRALAGDTVRQLQGALDALGVDARVALRTGDTPSAERARQKRKPPTTLVTTPESLAVMLSGADRDALFAQLDALVVDEWHELLGSKRGVLLQLCLAHLRARLPALLTWGLSATLGNLDEALAVLLGPDNDGALIRGETRREVRIHALLPKQMARFPWAGHLGLADLDAVIDTLDRDGTTLLFTNTRAQAELWHEALCNARPDWRDTLALHHGSLDRALREDIEARLRAGLLRCVVCTSSLDLGVDFQPVDRVLQVGSPKGVARLLQRAGRSGHRPGAVSEVLCVPTHAFELVEIAAARSAAAADRIEARTPPVMCLDVLAQHAVTLALGGGIAPQAMYEEARSTHAFATLDDRAWAWVMDFITRGGPALEAYPQFQRVIIGDDGLARVPDRRIARQHRMSIGTISADAAITLRWHGGGRLGSVEESFIARLRPGDRFLFSGRALEFVRVRDMVAWVRLARGRQRMVPRWQGGRMPLSTELADSVLEQFARVAGNGEGDIPPELDHLAAMFELQRTWSQLPVPGRLLVERVHTREGEHLFIYPFAGRLVHEGLATLLAHRLSKRLPATLVLSANDYGLELLSPEPLDLDAHDLRALLVRDALLEDLLECVNTGEVARRQFRDIARIAGLVFPGYPGAGKSVRQVQASSGLMYDVLARWDPDNLLLDQARREMLSRELEFSRLDATLERLAGVDLCLQTPPRLTPLAFPLWAERLQNRVVSSEDWRTRVTRMVERLEAAADRERVPR